MPTLIAISISSAPISLISIAGPGLVVRRCSLADGQTTTETGQDYSQPFYALFNHRAFFIGNRDQVI